ncbi:MAG: aminoacyl-tRNA hydrolase [Chromatiales bacterium]|nr:aminoacyl-tRNA hydrolase [Chromatiales bacterium]
MGVHIDRIIVVHDDTDLSISDVRVKRNGGDGGHKGLRSLFNSLGNNGFMTRIRIGVRTSAHGDAAPKHFVIQHFVTEDKPAVQIGMQNAIAAIQGILA